MVTICAECAKKIPIVYEIMCKCKCSKVFCLEHRLAEKHHCTHVYMFDATKLQPCVAPKV